MASNGLHAIDQFALVLALGEAVRPSGQGCFSLDVEKYSHWYPRTPKTQVTHDKTMDACIMEVDPTEEEAQLKILFVPWMSRYSFFFLQEFSELNCEFKMIGIPSRQRESLRQQLCSCSLRFSRCFARLLKRRGMKI
ncbi:unnamed protein product [Durusdinium trenchii]|uniref:Uncharacterized protein n=1 Tax=Durusdinium trenchii TaxID=1381693 RepID=A0ABP0K8P9_9DINO